VERVAAEARLQKIAEQLKLERVIASPNPGCVYDLYVAYGTNPEPRVAFAIRLGREVDALPFVAVKRLSNGRVLCEDQLPIECIDAAVAYFEGCVAIARLGEKLQTIRADGK
jgi:hypothetical protein